MRRESNLRFHFLLTILAGIVTLHCVSGFASAHEKGPEKPRLVVLLVIDQFRADYLTRFASRFLPAKTSAGVGGFRYLIENGAHYPLAEFETLHCMTGPGHATLLTGAYPYQLGVPSNYWFDQKTQSPAYCTDDPSTAAVGGDAKKPPLGTSPKTMMGTTLSDEWKNAGFPGKVVSVALKDRSAILMGGHRADLAIWQDPTAFEWMSSRKYRPDGKLPPWVIEENAILAKEKGRKFVWKAGGPGTGFSDASILPPAKYVGGGESSFPHEIERGTKRSIFSPYGVEITTRLALSALEAEKLGQEKSRTDFLFVSLSAHDYVAHWFGPNSRETEEMTVAEDREISRLLRAIDRRVGLANVVFALTADHGGAHAPEYLAKYGVPGGRIHGEKLREEGEALLVKRFGSPPKNQKWLPFAEDLIFFLNRPALEAKHEKARGEAEEILRTFLLRQEGAAFVFTRTDVSTGRLPGGELGRKIPLSYFAERSGDVTFIPRSGYVVDDDYSTHLTSYSYDRYVPLILTGRSFKPGRYAQTAKMVDLAPTLSYLLGIVPPSLSEGRPLAEILR
jgi:hypothetical protein